MGGLGNGRRVGRSPPLMIAALIACILVLGFNYWVSSSRNLELQTKLYELEGQVRRGAAERGAAELKRSEFEEEIKKQKEQIMHIENVYQSKLEEAQDTCSQVKATLQQNISSSTGAIQELKDQLNKLNDDLEKFQNELLSCQGDKETLNNRLTFEITQCQSQVQSQKEQCDERVAAAKLEVQKTVEKLIVTPVAQQQENAPEKKDVEEVKTLDDKGNASAVVSRTPAADQKAATVAKLLSNDIKDANASEDQASTKAVDKADHQPVTGAAVKPDVLPPPGGAAETEEGQEEGQKEGDKPEDKIVNEDKEMEALDGQAEEEADTEEDDPGMEGMLIQGKADETEVGPKIEEPEEYDADEPVVGGVDLEKQQQQAKNAEKADKEMELEPADYNGDDENEGEFEADKQAELAEI